MKIFAQHFCFANYNTYNMNCARIAHIQTRKANLSRNFTTFFLSVEIFISFSYNF